MAVSFCASNPLNLDSLPFIFSNIKNDKPFLFQPKM